MESRVRLELRIDWSEIDLFGHVNNLAIFKYIQAARVNYMEMIGLMQLQAEIRMGPILASATCQFRKPLFYPGKVTVFCRVDAIKNSSFHLQHEIRNDAGEIAAEAHDIIVMYDFERKHKLNIPEEIKLRITALNNT